VCKERKEQEGSVGGDDMLRLKILFGLIVRVTTSVVRTTRLANEDNLKVLRPLASMKLVTMSSLV
jgi:hypothetical protein